MGSEALSWLVSCFLTLLIPHFSPQMFSVSSPVAEGGGRTEMALLSWCERDFGVEGVVQMVTQEAGGWRAGI